MTEKANKASFRSKESDILYKLVIKKSVMFFCMILLMSLTVMIYLTADLYGQYCIEKIQRLEVVTENNLREFMFTQKKQLSCLKKKIKGATKINDFASILADCNYLNIDKLLIDHNGKILFNSSKKKRDLEHFSEKEFGFSLETLKKNPEKIIIGNIIGDKVLKRNYFFIASGVSNKNSNFTGILLLKINVAYLNEKIVPINHRILKVKDYVSKDQLSDSIYKYKQLQEFPVKTFLSNFLLKHRDIRVIKYNNSLNKYTESKYNSKHVMESFERNIYIFGCIVLTLLIFVFFIYWRMILLPMKESLMMMIQKNGKGRKTICKLFSVFYKLNDFNLNQSALISKQEQHEQFAKIISIIFSIGSLAQYVTSKVEILKEDIADMRTKNNKKLSSVVDFNKRLGEIEKTIATSEKDIRLLTSEYTKFTKLIKNQKRENIEISADKLNILVANKIVSANYNQKVKITPQVAFDIHVYKSFFIMLLDEILNFNNHELTLVEIKIFKKQKLQFIFKKINSNFIDLQNEQITVSKMLGVFNDIKVSILQDQEFITIDLNL